MHLLFAILFFISSLGWSKEKSETLKSTHKKIFASTGNRTPSQIIPLDAATEKFLKSSSLAHEVVEYDSEQKEFHRKAHSAYQKISDIIPLKEQDPLGYIYDCLFMIEEGFFLKYSKLPKERLIMSRKIVTETFNK